MMEVLPAASPTCACLAPAQQVCYQPATEPGSPRMLGPVRFRQHLSPTTGEPRRQGLIEFQGVRRRAGHSFQAPVLLSDLLKSVCQTCPPRRLAAAAVQRRPQHGVQHLQALHVPHPDHLEGRAAPLEPVRRG